MNYDFAAIEKKWQDNWEKTKPYAAITGDPTQVLRAHRVPVPQCGGPPCRTSPALYRHRHRHPEKAHGGL